MSQIVQLGGILFSMYIWSSPYLRFKRTSPPAKSLAKSLTKSLENMGAKKNMGSGVTLTNNEIKDIMKVMKSLENRGILLKETIKNLIVKKKDFTLFLDH